MTKLTEVFLILFAGCIGGLVSTLDSWQASLSIASTAATLLTAGLIPALKGAVAAGVGVYLLTTVDSAQFTRTFFFAVTCGLAFPSILTSGASYASRVTASVASGEVSKSAETVRATSVTAASASAPAAAASAIGVIKDAAVNAIQVAPKANPTDARTAEVAVNQAIGAIATGPTAASSPMAASALGDIGVAAAGQNLPASRDLALRELEQIRTRPGLDQSVLRETAAATRRIEAAKSAAQR